MRTWWILSLFGAAWLAPLALADETAPPTPPPAAEGGAFATQNDGFSVRQPLGAFQPTDVGAPPEAGPMPPEQLAPQFDSAPLKGAADPAEPAQPATAPAKPAPTVAPAQFQAPVEPNTAPPVRTEPKTTIVPGSAAPAFQPATPQSPPHSAAEQPEPQNLAQSLYQQAITPPMTGAIAGTPISLQNALARRTDPARYAEFVRAYWRLSQSLAAYHEALQGAVELSRLPQPREPHQQSLLQAATTAAEVEVRQARLQVLSAQWDLAERMTGEATAPLPEDLPLMSAYRSKFDAVFAGRVPPAGARRLHETFAARLALVEGRAAAVVACENAFGALADAYAQGQVELADVLREHARLHEARRAFLSSVYDYNAAIADYAYLAAGPHRSPETIVSMLVERPKPASPDAAPANFVAP